MAKSSVEQAPSRKGMSWVPGGTFSMGSDDFYPEERPIRRVAVDGFWMDEHPVTNARFRRFVKDTGYVTVAERPLDPALLVPGSLVFHETRGPVDLRDVGNWWVYVPGASWRHPEGPGSNLGGRERHPVVHVAHEDAESHARWAGLPRRCRIVLEGELSEKFAEQFEGMDLERCGGKTFLLGEIIDLSHLRGILNRVEDLGLELLSVAEVSEDERPQTPEET